MHTTPASCVRRIGTGRVGGRFSERSGGFSNKIGVLEKKPLPEDFVWLHLLSMEVKWRSKKIALPLRYPSPKPSYVHFSLSLHSQRKAASRPPFRNEKGRGVILHWEEAIHRRRWCRHHCRRCFRHCRCPRRRDASSGASFVEVST